MSICAQRCSAASTAPETSTGSPSSACRVILIISPRRADRLKLVQNKRELLDLRVLAAAELHAHSVRPVIHPVFGRCGDLPLLLLLRHASDVAVLSKRQARIDEPRSTNVVGRQPFT